MSDVLQEHWNIIKYGCIKYIVNLQFYSLNRYFAGKWSTTFEAQSVSSLTDDLQS